MKPKTIYSNADYLLPLTHYFSVIILLKLNTRQSRTKCHIRSELLVSENTVEVHNSQDFSFYKTFCWLQFSSTKMKFLFRRVDTGKGNARTALLSPTLSDTPVCQIPAWISECLPLALPSLTVTILNTNVISEKQLTMTTFQLESALSLGMWAVSEL